MTIIPSSLNLHRWQPLVLQELGRILIEAVIRGIHSHFQVGLVYDQHHHGDEQEDAEGHDAGGPLTDGLLTREVLLCEGQEDLSESRVKLNKL